jgi:hypothetical protein
MLYDLFATIAAIGGIYSGVYFWRPSLRYFKQDKLLGSLMFVYMFSAFWLAGIYLLGVFDLIYVPVLTIGAYTRPATMIMLWVPALIMQRVGL